MLNEDSGCCAGFGGVCFLAHLTPHHHLLQCFWLPAWSCHFISVNGKCCLCGEQALFAASSGFERLVIPAISKDVWLNSLYQPLTILVNLKNCGELSPLCSMEKPCFGLPWADKWYLHQIIIMYLCMGVIDQYSCKVRDTERY